MKRNTFLQSVLKICSGILVLSNLIISNANAQTTQLTLDLSKPGANVSPMLYGLMTEEINHSYDGGLYAELIRNRIFKDNKSRAWFSRRSRVGRGVVIFISQRL